MKEKEFINIIKNTLNSKYIGDDCAYLKELGIVVTQDSLVEDVHFKMDFTTPYQLGYKSVMVNISDICASGAKPLYLTIALSLPQYINSDFVKQFYQGAKKACNGVEIVGGDITGSDKIFISITAIGSSKNRTISSRSSAKAGYKIILSGNHGSSAAGLRQLINGEKNGKFVNAHLMPVARIEFSKNLAENINEAYAMMDTSDGLMDALSTIAKESNVLMSIDFDKIPFDKDLKNFNDYTDLILYGGEDYELIAAVPENFAQGYIIGDVLSGQGGEIKYDNKKVLYTSNDIENKLFNHFKENS